MTEQNEGGLSPQEQDDAAETAKSALVYDEFGRPVLPVSQAYTEAQAQGYYGNDGKDLGAGVRPEDVRSFQEHADAGVDQPAHSEPVVIENPGGQGGYTALGTPNAPAPVIGGDATSADAPSINTPSENGAQTAEPVEASSTGSLGLEGTTAEPEGTEV